MNKYHAVACRCLMRHHAPHHSRLEADYCNILLAKMQGGEIHDFMAQHKIELYVNGLKICNHYVDFAILAPGGKIKEFHEVKGMATEMWRIKRALTVALFPKIPYITKYKGDIAWNQKETKRTLTRRNRRPTSAWLRLKCASISRSGR